MRTGIEILFTGLLLWILVSALLSPLESLGWWAGWFGEAFEEDEEESEDVAAAVALDESAVQPSNANFFIVFLTGIAGVAQEVHLPEEQDLLRRLAARLPDAEIVDDIFPYSVTNRALTGQRVFSWFWRFAFSRKQKGGRIGFVINIRNLFQVLVSADRRYGPIYNRGSAQLVLRGLRRHGYELGSQVPVILLGYSGGSQISVGAAPYLEEQLGIPVTIISVGGVLCADPGLMSVQHLYHLRGKRDRVEQLGYLLSPGRWPIFPNSHWNRANIHGKITQIELGTMAHTGPGSYLDDTTPWDASHTYMDKTVESITELVSAVVPT